VFDEQTGTAEDETGQAEHEGSQDDRLDRVENKLDQLTEAVAKLIPGSHAEAQQRTERRLDRPSRAEDVTRATVREELAKVKREDAEAAAGEAQQQSVADRLAKLEEQPPVQHRSPAKRFATHGWE